MATILLINADETLRRMVRLALPGMEHVIRYAGTLTTAQIQATSLPLDLVIARFVVRDDQGPEDLAELRKTFPDIKIIVSAALHEPALETDKFRWVAQELHIDHCLIEPIEPAAVLETMQTALDPSRQSSAAAD